MDNIVYQPPDNATKYSLAVKKFGSFYWQYWRIVDWFYFYDSVSVDNILSYLSKKFKEKLYHMGELDHIRENSYQTADGKKTLIWNALEKLPDTNDVATHFRIIDDAIAHLYNTKAKEYVTTTQLNELDEKLYKKTDRPPEDGYKFDVIRNYHKEKDYDNPDENTDKNLIQNTHIDDKFYAVDRVLLKYYYKKNGGKTYTFNVIDGYNQKTTIDEKFYALDQALNDLYYKKNNVINYSDTNSDENTHINKYFQTVDKYIQDNKNIITDYLNKSGETIKDQIKTINENTKIIEAQETLIEDNQTAILNKIKKVKAIADANKKEISLNLEKIEPSQSTTQIFNILAAQANEDISLNTEVIRPKDSNESLNKMDKNNEAQADNNALYVMVTALTAPFIGLSLYYSSDTEENIDNEIEAF